ncbi:hypothetical protein CEXT_546551 [Caerostris extrusa]|uniref:Uncharacterized protein n=1 Tax=Caerostris extrusa TaxID=172846 RepID=A0AAV4Y0N9_CAEEX|nr:hypothetical protein CEXT_546551 [Caerostris extrusa]
MHEDMKNFVLFTVGRVGSRINPVATIAPAKFEVEDGEVANKRYILEAEHLLEFQTKVLQYFLGTLDIDIAEAVMEKETKAAVKRLREKWEKKFNRFKTKELDARRRPSADVSSSSAETQAFFNFEDFDTGILNECKELVHTIQKFVDKKLTSAPKTLIEFSKRKYEDYCKWKMMVEFYGEQVAILKRELERLEVYPESIPDVDYFVQGDKDRKNHRLSIPYEFRGLIVQVTGVAHAVLKKYESIMTSLHKHLPQESREVEQIIHEMVKDIRERDPRYTTQPLEYHLY